MSQESGAEAVGETKESDEVAAFILRRADVVMEVWQVANALQRMSVMIAKDKRRMRKLRRASEYVVANFVDNMTTECFKEAKERERRWREELDSQENLQRTARAINRQKRAVADGWKTSTYGDKEAPIADEKEGNEQGGALIQAAHLQQPQQQEEMV